MLSETPLTITFTNRTIIRVVVLIVLSILGLALVRRLDHSLTLIFISFFLAVSLNPAVSWIARHLKSKSRTRATGVAYLIVVLILALLIAMVVPPLVKQASSFVQSLPQTIENYKTHDSTIAQFIRDHNLSSQLDNVATTAQANLQNFGRSTVSTVSKVGSLFITVLTIFVLTFMMLVEGPYWLEKFWSLQPTAKIPKRKKVLQRMYNVVTGYVNGQLLIALIAGSFALVALLISSTLLDVSINAVALALIVMIVGLIPMFGNTIAAVLVVLICAFSSLPLALIMLGFFLIYQQVENVTIQPVIQARHNELTPLLVFIAALVGIGFGGVLGAFVAIPAAGCLKVLIHEYYGDRLVLKTNIDE